MDLYLGLTLFSFALTAAAVVPFINVFYFWTEERSKPEGGGILVVIVTTIIFLAVIPLISRLGIVVVSLFNFTQELHLILLAFLGFGILGFIDDYCLLKFNKYVVSYRWWWMTILAVLIAAILKINLGISILNIPFWGVLNLGWGYVPLTASLILLFIYGFQKADDVDGLPLGGLMVSLVVFWFLSQAALDSILTMFLAIWLGSVVAFLYFNVSPSRIRLGRSGELAFGAALAVVGLLLGKPIALLIIGGVFIVEAFGGVLFKYFGISSLQKYLKARGWTDAKIMMRGWLVSLLLAIFGLWLATL
jgi:phospho-N-acetylmuramoyl-pentapeptide-transferase